MTDSLTGQATTTPTTNRTSTSATGLDFECPRCGQATNARFYGPCGSCADQLRENHQAEARQVEAPEYEPKMNVTPNAVATKE